MSLPEIMGNYTIQLMKDEMLPELKLLFGRIYPDEPELVRKLLYKNNASNHIVTVVAEEAPQIIGQANIFRKTILDEIINIGYHVDPDYRSKGVATQLVEFAIKKAREKGFSEFHIITDAKNIPACRVAEKMLFKEISLEKIENLKIYNRSIR